MAVARRFRPAVLVAAARVDICNCVVVILLRVVLRGVVLIALVVVDIVLGVSEFLGMK